MRDRTQELRAGLPDVSKINSSSKSKEEEKLLEPDSELIDDIFLQVREISQEIDLINQKVKELEKEQLKILSTPLPEDAAKQDLQQLRDEIKNLAQNTRSKLQALKLSDEEEQKCATDMQIRMKKTQYGILRQRFVDAVNKCSTLQAQYRDRNVERIQRQLKITGVNVTDENLEDMIESGNAAVFTSNILTDTRATKQALNEIESRHEEILKLEKSIRELHDMFMYLSMEIEAQGEMVNRIESNILESVTHVQKASEHTHKTVKLRKKANKKKIAIIACICITVVILAVLIAIFVR
ncbi:syntaxin-4 [Protopterus annectens]|uniref:syntaxin-4 n=1 Tax=Protopterus annectens TaxID=7888 RepID=UPI001CFB0821|nr:syntaxin-4 [Protopterus annectens]